MSNTSIDLMSTHIEDIEKLFKGTLSHPQMEWLMRLHDEVRMMQRAINDVTAIAEAMKEVAVITVAQSKSLEQRFKALSAKYTDNNQDLIRNEEIN